MKVCTTCGAEYGDDQLFCQRDGTPLRKSGAAGDLLGQVIAERYHITKKLGEGGMGQVYLAEHVKMGRRCAIKIMMPGTMSDPDAISRFNREAANASRISHPNVCAIYDFGETPDGLIYLAMELIEGKSLTALMEEAGTIPLTRAAAMVLQTAEALQVAHDLGIVHRDLKPDNIMVITSRGKDTVKVVDFGIAKAIGGDDGKAQKVTKTGFVVGTPEYMSPEQLSGDAVDGRSDLYSLGLVFYRMLTGSSPFPADSQQETMIKRLTDDPVPLALARPDVKFPAELQRVIDRALARDPETRYRSAGEFARDVRALVTNFTGPVDVEAGTQVVRPEELKASVPATRVDPAAARKRPPPAPPGDGPATRAGPVAERKGFPVMPVAIAVAVLALAGGGFAVKDRLFGGAGADSSRTGDSAQRATQTPGPSDSGRIPAGTDPPVTQVNRPDSAKPASPGNVRPAGGQATNPAGGTTTPPRPGDPPPEAALDPAAVRQQLTALLDTVSEFPDRRGIARTRAEVIYRNRTMSASIRGDAASIVMQSYMEDANTACTAGDLGGFSRARDQARTWAINATALDEKYQRQADLVDKLSC